MEPFGELIDAYQRAGVDFVFTELETARTFLQTAAISRVEETRVRNRQNAKIAYQTALRYAREVMLRGEEKQRIEKLLAELKVMLLEAGVTL